MNKVELVTAVQKTLGSSKADAERVREQNSGKEIP
jgi:hypothetical protein